MYYAACAADRASRAHTRRLITVRTRCCRLLCQGYTMRDEDGNGSTANPDHDGGIRTAVRLWCRDPAAAKARYGPIASWNTSGVTNMISLFYEQDDFNEDISRWNVSNVVTMGGMFYYAALFNGDLSCWDVGQVQDMFAMFMGTTSFDRQLGGAWSTSTATKVDMFYNSPDTIAGKTKDARGSIE